MILFGISSTIQLENIATIFRYLASSGVQCSLLNLDKLQTSDNLEADISEARKLKLSNVVKAIFYKFPTQTKILFMQQDVGLVEKILLNKAKKAKIYTCIAPDGMIWGDRNLTAEFSIRKAFNSAVLLVFELIGLLESRSSRWFNSQPSHIFLWGTEWQSIAEENSPGSQMTISGCPRFSNRFISKVPGTFNLLLASTPVELLNFSEPEILDYYQSLTKHIESSDLGQIRLRLHPFELSSSKVPEMLKTISSSRGLEEDLNWAHTVLSPVSTVLLEAALLGRQVGFFAEHKNLSQLRESNIFFQAINNLQQNPRVEKLVGIDLGGHFNLDIYCRQVPNPTQVIGESLLKILGRS